MMEEGGDRKGMSVPGEWNFRECTLSDDKAGANRNRGRTIREAQNSRREQEHATGVEWFGVVEVERIERSI